MSDSVRDDDTIAVSPTEIAVADAAGERS